MANWMRNSMLAIVVVAAFSSASPAQENSAQDNTATNGGIAVTSGSGAEKYAPTRSKEPTFAQLRNRYEMQQRVMRAEYFKWIGYEPLRPNVIGNPYYNASPAPYWHPYSARYVYPTPVGTVYRW